VLSAELGLAKPDPRIYQMTLSQLGSPPERALFIDDMARNIEAARKLGMQTLHFREPEKSWRQIGHPDDRCHPDRIAFFRPSCQNGDPRQPNRMHMTVIDHSLKGD